MGLTQIYLIAVYSVAVFSVIAQTFVSGDDTIMQKRSELFRRLDEEQKNAMQKRPFCNAFTGCGKKRSDESMDSLVELNSEPAVEELNKQILSEAKLWEAIQEARAELERRRRERENMTARKIGFAINGFRRKRSSTLDLEPINDKVQGQYRQ